VVETVKKKLARFYLLTSQVNKNLFYCIAKVEDTLDFRISSFAKCKWTIWL